jgi:hypothetical protein
MKARFHTRTIPGPEDDKLVGLTFKAPPELVEAIRAYSGATKTSMSWVIRSAVEGFFTQLPSPIKGLSDE